MIPYTCIKIWYHTVRTQNGLSTCDCIHCMHLLFNIPIITSAYPKIGVASEKCIVLFTHIRAHVPKRSPVFNVRYLQQFTIYIINICICYKGGILNCLLSYLIFVYFLLMNIKIIALPLPRNSSCLAKQFLDF